MKIYIICVERKKKIGVLRTFVVSVCLKIKRYIMPQNCNNHTDYRPTKHHKGHRASFAAVTWEGSGEAVNDKWRKYELALKCHRCSLMEIISINLWKKKRSQVWKPCQQKHTLYLLRSSPSDCWHCCPWNMRMFACLKQMRLRLQKLVIIFKSVLAASKRNLCHTTRCTKNSRLAF